MILRPLTEAEARARDQLNHPHWGGGLDVGEHVAREAALRGTAWARAARRGWAWAEGERILASCETFEVAGRVAGAPGRAFQIASVFTEPALRGRGHASALLDALARALGRRRGARALTLYSDVDPGIYTRLGFVARPAVDRVLPARAGPPGQVRGVTEGELARVLGRRAAAGSVALPVTAAMLDWQIDHARQVAARRGGRRPARCGARVGRELVVWMEQGEELLVLLLDAPTQGAALLDEAARTAAAVGLRGVRGWQTPGWPAGVGTPLPRAGALPMIRPLGPGLDPAGWVDVPRGLWV